MRWARASSHPKSSTQPMLPITEPTPASAWRMTVLPKGHAAYPARRNEATPNGIVMIRMQARILKST